MAAPLLPVIVQENWAQCENPNCNKWRRLPPDFEVKEDEPWYCYLNPDENKATCSASEDEYNEATMVELGPAGVDLDEAEQSRRIREQLTGKLLASSGLPLGAALPPLPILPAGGGKGKGGRGRGRGKGRGKGRGGAAAAAPGSQSDPYYQKRKSSGGPKYKEDSDEEFITDEEDLLPAPAAPRVRHQAPPATYARHFARLLENQGSWEPARGKAVGGGAELSMPPTAEAWEGLGQHAPEFAEVAVAAADVASSLKYFEAAPGSEAAQASEAADAVARLSAMLASAAGLVATHGEGLSQEQRRACCLDAAAAVKQEPPAAAAVSALPPQTLVLAGQPPGAAALPFALPPPQPGAAQPSGWQMPQPAAMVAQQQHQQQQPMQVQQAQQPMGLQIGGGMAQPAAGWPGMQLPFANGQQQQQQAQLMQQPMAGMQQALGMQQPLDMQQAMLQQMQQALPQQMQQALPQQFAGMLPPQQWAMPGLAMPGSTAGGMPLAPGVTGATVQQYMQLLQQKPGGQQQQQQQQQQQANGTQH